MKVFENFIQLIIWSFFLPHETKPLSTIMYFSPAECAIFDAWIFIIRSKKSNEHPHSCKQNANTGCISLRPVLASCSKGSKSELVGCRWSPLICSGSMIISPGRSLRIPKPWFDFCYLQGSRSTPWIELKITWLPSKIDHLIVYHKTTGWTLPCYFWNTLLTTINIT